jgi:hypothetical protein
VGCAAKPDIGLTASGSAGALTGVASTATFAVGLAFLDDTRRTGAFFGAFSLIAFERFLALCLAFTFGLRSCRQYSLPGAHYYIETHGQMVAE